MTFRPAAVAQGIVALMRDLMIGFWGCRFIFHRMHKKLAICNDE